ncbi:MAG: galactokinase [Verrucomicrobium sp.]|nr:galactokinase [Verrucomicrobium sp.]
MTLQAYAPGRAELLGNHTDYNEGLVLAIAVDRGVQVRGTVREDDAVLLRAEDLDRAFQTRLAALAPTAEEPWANYSLGVLAGFAEKGIPLRGVELSIGSTLPMGAGLSSSAALETATALFLQKAFDPERRLGRLDLARIGQQAEHAFVGVRCGLLDQISSGFGKAGHATFIDCRTLEVENIPLPEGFRFVVANSGVKHALVSSEYNTRRESCEAAAKALGVRALRDVSSARLAAGGLDPLTLRRARHVVTENERVAAAVGLLRRGDAEGFGALMFASHLSSRDDFENSCPELDLLVEAARAVPGCLGARLSGGGFGGATINLIQAGREEALIAALEKAVPGTRCLVTAAAEGAA